MTGFPPRLNDWIPTGHTGVDYAHEQVLLHWAVTRLAEKRRSELLLIIQGKTIA